MRPTVTFEAKVFLTNGSNLMIFLILLFIFGHFGLYPKMIINSNLKSVNLYFDIRSQQNACIITH